MKVKDKGAFDKVINGRIGLLLTNGFFGFLAMQLKIVEEFSIPTGAVDGVNFYYNPNFVNQLDDREIQFLWAHEVMHCCFKHFERRGSRNPEGWNIAGDFVINYDLKKSGFKLIYDRPIDGKNFKCCIDDKYANMSTEEVYDKLPKVYINLGSIVGEVRDTPGGAAQAETIAQNWEKQVRAAVAVATADNAGNIPGSLRNLIKALNAPKISWRDKTRRFIDQSTTRDISWQRISRRSVSIGTLLPGLVSDRMHKLVCFCDTSGSVSHKMAAEMLSEVNGALDDGTADVVIVAYADTQVQHVDEYMQGDYITAGQYSGGGTAFSNSFKWLADNHPDASCVIYLTDLEVFDFGEEPSCPVMWAVYQPSTNYDHWASRVPFGMPIHVSETT